MININPSNYRITRSTYSYLCQFIPLHEVNSSGVSLSVIERYVRKQWIIETTPKESPAREFSITFKGLWILFVYCEGVKRTRTRSHQRYQDFLRRSRRLY